MNVCHFMGNITHDPELRTVGDKKTPVLNFSIAVSRSYKRGTGETVKETNFIALEAWDSGAETIHRHFKKGDPIIVHCSVKTDKYVDKETGQNRTATKFRVDRFEFVLSKPRRNEEVTEASGDNDTSGSNGDDPIPF